MPWKLFRTLLIANPRDRGENSGAWKYVAKNYLVYFTKKSGGHGHIATGFPDGESNTVIHVGGNDLVEIAPWQTSGKSAHLYLGYILNQ